MSTKIIEDNNAEALDLSNNRLSEYFKLDIEIIIGIRERIIDFIFTPGYHNVVDQMMIIDEDYPDPMGNSQWSYSLW